MHTSTRLVINTLSTYLRMAVTVGFGLLAMRWAKLHLGDVDFGIWCALLAIGGTLLVLSESVSGSVERFLAFELGRTDAPGRQREFFATALAAMSLVAVAAFIIGLPMGFWIIAGTIQSDPKVDPIRAAGASVQWAYALVLIGQCLTVICTPFRSMFIAHQSAALLTIIDTGESIMRLLAVVAMMSLAGDNLVQICGFTLAAQGLTALAVLLFCLRTYPESRSGIRGASLRALRELALFTGWAALGIVSYRIRLSGMPLLLLKAFGPAASGPFSIAVTLAGYQLNLSSAVGKAAQPAVTSAVGARDHGRVLRLIPPVNKFATLMASFYLVPLMIEAEGALTVWLGSYAPETPTFVRIMLLLMGLPWFYMGYHTAMFADGRIRHYMIAAVLFEAVGLAIAALLVTRLGFPSWAIPAMGLTTACCMMAYSVFHISRMLAIPLGDWLTGTWAPVLSVTLPAGLAAWGAHLAAPAAAARLGLPLHDLARIITVGATYGLAAAPLIWIFGVGAGERVHFKRILGGAVARLRGKPA